MNLKIGPDLTYREVDSIDEAKQIANQYKAHDFHILMKNMKIVLVLHPIWDKCMFCDMELEDDAPIIIGKNDYLS